MHRKHWALVLLLVTGLTFVLPVPAHGLAATVVTLCDVDNQSGAGVNLNQALAVGGRIAFNCHPNTLLRVTSSKRLQMDVSIDGLSNGSPVTLIHAIPGGGILPIFQTLPGVSLELVDLDFSTSLSAVTAGGVLSQGTLRANHV